MITHQIYGVVSNAFVTGSIFILLIKEVEYVKGEKVSVTAYTCCSIQDTFKENFCTSVQPNSEFDTEFPFHQALWLVPKSLKEENTEIELELEKRNTTKTCKEALRIYQNVSEQEGRNQNSFIARNKSTNSIAGTDYNNEHLKFASDGSLTYKSKLYNPSEYCFDRLSQTEMVIVLFGCFKPVFELTSPIRYRHHERDQWIKAVFATLAGMSFFFMLANTIIYLTLRKYLNESGWTEFAYFITLGTFSVLSIPAVLYKPSSSADEEVACYILSVALQFLEVATYSSYLMITFDVHWMLRKSVRVGSYGEDDSVSRIRLTLYYFLLLCIPLTVTLYGLVLNHGLIPALEFSEIDKPNYGEKSCFSPRWSVSEYVNFGMVCITFLLILLSINMIFGRLSASSDVDDPSRVSLLSNMFYFTLTYWVIGLLQFTGPIFMKTPLYKSDERKDENDGAAETFWSVLEGFGYAQGTVAFLVFVCNRKTLRAFRKKSGSDGTLRDMLAAVLAVE